jgi:hypothetical protein
MTAWFHQRTTDSIDAATGDEVAWICGEANVYVSGSDSADLARRERQAGTRANRPFDGEAAAKITRAVTKRARIRRRGVPDVTRRPPGVAPPQCKHQLEETRV